MSRDLLVQNSGGLSSKPVAKGIASSKKVKVTSSEDVSAMKKKTESVLPNIASFTEDDSEEIFSEEKRRYNILNTEFSIRVTDLFSPPSVVNPIPYLFEIKDMVIDVDASEEEQKKTPEKNPKKMPSKVIKDTIKPSKEFMWQSTDKDEFASLDSAGKAKIEMLDSSYLL